MTSEQREIIKTDFDIRINAVAGSGKTSTIIEYAKSRPSGSRILYLAFNRAIKLEAAAKFASKGLNFVKVETAHSIAFKHIVFRHGYKLKAGSYTSQEMAQFLNLKSFGEKHDEFVMANHINRFLTYYCNSKAETLDDLNYLDLITDPKAMGFANSYINTIKSKTQQILDKMDSAEIEIIHDFYLKKFQLSGISLPYDYILFDEAQDASPAMLEVFMKQKATKVIVGDSHQQIYSWRHAVNSLDKAKFDSYSLTNSFRFDQNIAHLSNAVLSWKNILKEGMPSVSINGAGNSNQLKSKAIIARTNLGLLLKAIDYINQNPGVKKIHFEGNFNSYTYADEGTSLYDVLNLHLGMQGRIRDKLLRSMNSETELEEYIEKTEDAQMGMMLEIVREYGEDIPFIINSLKQKQVPDANREEAQMIFSTVHRCKGMEYDQVTLVDDFITEAKVKKAAIDLKDNPSLLPKAFEEINLLYVAITRTRNLLYIPESLLPEGFESTSNIILIKPPVLEEIPMMSQVKELVQPSKMHELKKKHKSAYQSWSAELDQELTQLFCDGTSISELAKHFSRTKGAIWSRIKKLELQEKYG